MEKAKNKGMLNNTSGKTLAQEVHNLSKGGAFSIESLSGAK